MAPEPAPKRQRKRAVAGLVGALLLVGVGAVLHMPVARSLLSRAGVGGCPMQSSSPEERDAHRAASLQPLRGAARAPSRAALGLNLGQSRAEDISAWATRTGATCTREEASGALQCRQDDGANGGADLSFLMDAKGVLQGVDVMRDKTTVEVGTERLHQFAADLQAALGPPTARTGDPSVGFLGAPFQRADIRYRFQDYAVDLSATNFGGDGLVVREQYRVLPD